MAAFAKSVLLAETYDEEMDPTGWWVSEKLDGVRAYWNGSNFYSRSGNMFYAPKSFTKDLPKCALDGELWCGRGLFQKCVSIVKTKKNVSEEDWKYVTYLVFDAPEQTGPYEDRVKYLKSIINPQKKTTFAAVVGIKKCDGPEHLQKCLEEVIKLGGEGLMLRKPGSKYAHGRSSTLLKVKTFHDEEAKVIGYEKGEGRLAGMMGALKCVLTNGVEFKIGTGFSDEQRRKPPKIGSIVTFKYQELSNDGNPRFPAYLRERTDVTWAEVLESAKTKPPFSTKKKVIPTLKKQHTIMFSTVPSLDPETGEKVVTEDDVHDDGGNDSNDEADTSKTNTKAAGNAKPACKYGASCYQTNAVHLANFTHPPKPQAKASPATPKAANLNKNKSALKDEDEGSQGSSNNNNKKKAAPKDEEENSQGNNTNAATQKTPCKFGAACYQTSAFHLSKYSHPPKGTPVDEGEKLTQEEIKEFKGLEDEDEQQEETVTISKREYEDLKFQLQASEERVVKLEEIIKTIRGSVSDVDTTKGTSGDKKRKLDQSAEMPPQKKSKPNSIL